MFQANTILIPTDFSDPAEAAHAAACDVARAAGAQLIVLHVTDKPVVSYIEKATELPPDEFQRKLWETLRWPRDREKGLTVQHRVVEGDPVTQIGAVAQEINCDLIVMGTHGRRGLLGWFTSTVTEQVIRKAPCSVLVVKSTDQAGQAAPPGA